MVLSTPFYQFRCLARRRQENRPRANQGRANLTAIYNPRNKSNYYNYGISAPRTTKYDPHVYSFRYEQLLDSSLPFLRAKQKKNITHTKSYASTCQPRHTCGKYFRVPCQSHYKKNTRHSHPCTYSQRCFYHASRGFSFSHRRR